PLDSEIDRKVAALVPVGRPGRGLVPSKLHFLGALPRIDGDGSADTLGDGVDHLIDRTAAAWKGPQGPKLRLLPEKVTLEAVREDAVRRQLPQKHVLLGINERELAPIGLDVDAEPHMLVFGDGQSGKSALLRAYVHEVMRTRTVKEAQIVLVDYRRSLLGEVPDDYALVPPAQSSPVSPLQPLMAQARDVGLHVVVARRTGGASRALYEPVIQSLRDLAMPGVMLSGPRDEGVLIGNLRPQPAP